MCFHLPLQGGGSRLRLDLAFLSGSELGLASGFFISLALGFRSFCCSFAFSFGLGLGGRCLSLCRYSFFVLALCGERAGVLRELDGLPGRGDVLLFFRVSVRGVLCVIQAPL